ncbi:MAG: nuclear transport factor 2 family protein [Lachnospiraceae bacterium]|nr:nuclear transport factor 2 family protein [Lachnospiraceae bacterium]
MVKEIKHPTPIESDLEKAIKDRLFNGFNNWNGGYDGWLEWCNTLYEPDAHYNVYGKRLTLAEYQGMMGKLFEHFTMELGDFENMIIRENWCAIRYTVKIINLHTKEEILQNTMEFVEFKDNGGEIGVRVVEGWALSDSPLSAQG